MGDLLRRAALSAKTATVLRADRRTAAELASAERLDTDVLDALTTERALRMVAFAAAASPYYRDRYAAAGLTADDLRDPAVLDSLPVVEKQDLREQFDRFATPEASPRTGRVGWTSGSTGEPMRVLIDTRVPARTIAWRQHRWWGVTPYDNVAHAVRGDRGPDAGVLHRLERWPTRHPLLDGGQVDEASVAAFTAAWHAARPALLLGYLSTLVELATFLLAAGERLPPPRAVGVTASPVTAPERRLLADTFGAPVYDTYRSAEVAFMAAECRSGRGLHVHSDLRRLEVVGPDGRSLPPGETGEVVVTDLCNRVAPLVRYRLGDRASLLPGRCDCGLGLPLLSSVDGRSVDTLRLPGGQSVTTGVTSLFDGAPSAVRQFEVRQHADHSVVLRCVRGPDAAADQAMARAVEDLRARCLGQVPVRLEVVDRIATEGGKTRVVRSDVRRSGL
jgi:phenylacetate-CoA ligase